jgi:hypothetical protein
MARFKPSPAMMVALLALFVAFGGTGYAALKLPRNSVGAAQIKANAVRSTEVEQGSLRASDFGASQLSSLRGPRGVAGPRGSQGRQGVAGAPATKLWAVPSDDCTSLLRGSGAVSVRVSGPSNARCDVKFDRDLRSCVPQATLQNTQTTYAGEIEATIQGDSQYIQDADTVAVTTYVVGTQTWTRRPFYLTVFC